MRNWAPLIFLLASSCALRRPPGPFRVLPSNPTYLRRAPDARQTPFPEVLGRFTRYTTGWVDLRPRTELHLQNAYCREGMARHDLSS